METKASRYDTLEIDGRKVRELRKRLRLTQEALVAAMGQEVSRGYVSIIERTPRGRVSRATAEKLATALSVRIEALTAAAGEDVLPRRPEEDFSPAAARRLLTQVLGMSGADQLRELLRPEEHAGEGAARPAAAAFEEAGAEQVGDEPDVSALPIRGFSRKRRLRPGLQSPAERQDETLRDLLQRIREMEQVVEALRKQISEIKQTVEKRLGQC